MASGMKTGTIGENEKVLLGILANITRMTDSEYLSFRERVLNALMTEDMSKKTRRLIKLIINTCDRERHNMIRYLVTCHNHDEVAAKTTTSMSN